MLEQDSIPEVESTPLTWNETVALYQPLEPVGVVLGVTVTLGTVESYLMPIELEPVRPAGSVQLPVTNAVALSGPEYDVVAEHTPEIEVPVMSNVTIELYQP